MKKRNPCDMNTPGMLMSKSHQRFRLTRGVRDIDLRLDQKCLDWLNSLPEGKMRKKVEGMLDTLKERVDVGNYVPRSLWPNNPAYHDIRNLFRYEIDRAMRATYT